MQGRKRAGGIRFGEMERDALLAHGTSFLLQDRLMNCSDYSTAWVCRTCGSLISLGYEDTDNSASASEYCRICDGSVGAAHGDAVNVNVPGAVTLQKQAGKKGEMDVIAVPCE